MVAFADRLKDERTQKGLTQSELARTLFLGQTSVSKYERGKQIPEMPTLQKIADFFGISIDYLLGKTDIKKYVQNDQRSNSIADDKLIEKMKNLDEESKKELEKYMDLLKLKESMCESKDETSSTLQKHA